MYCFCVFKMWLSGINYTLSYHVTESESDKQIYFVNQSLGQKVCPPPHAYNKQLFVCYTL